MKENASPGDDLWMVDASGTHHLSVRHKGAAAEVVFAEAKQRWSWQFRLPPEFCNGPQPSASACSLEGAKAACEAIAEGIGESGHIGSHPIREENKYVKPQLQNHRWKAVMPHYFQLRPRQGRWIASVSYNDHRSAWTWYFADLPKEWWGKGLPPTGRAISMVLAKVICETIVAGTIESQPPMEEEPVTLASFKTIPFKHGQIWREPCERKAFEKKIKFRFPDDLMASYGHWNGGSLDGFFVFDTAVCKEMCGNKFFSLLESESDEDEFSDSILTAVQSSPLLRKYPLDEIPFIPFADAGASRAPEERHNPHNVPSLLAFARETKAVFLLSGYKNRKVYLARSWKEFASIAEVVPDE